MKKNVLCVLILTGLILLTDCAVPQQLALPQQLSPEFVISNLYCKKGYDENACVLGGVYFDILNKSEEEIIYMELNVRLCDSKTGAPAFPINPTISIKYDGCIESLEKKEMCISLDNYITFDSPKEFLIDAFIINKIVYADGTVWNDFFGMYGIFRDN